MIYEKSVRELFRDCITDFTKAGKQVILRKEIFQWFQSKYPKIKKGTVFCHINLFSTNDRNRVHHNAKPEHDLLIKIDDERLRLFDKAIDPPPIYDKNGPIESPPIDETPSENGFPFERDLRNFLVKNLELVEKDLKLYRDGENENITGVEYPVGGRFIDILAVDKNNQFVVIELKVSRGHDRVVGQILRYMAWVIENLAEKNQIVRGIIIAKEISTDLFQATSLVQNLELFEYDLSVSLRKKIKDNPSAR